MPDMITRCPQCGTSFRITPSQLKTAKGAVRCGSCLQIFKALDNLVDQPVAAKTSSHQKKAQPTPEEAPPQKEVTEPSDQSSAPAPAPVPAPTAKEKEKAEERKTPIHTPTFSLHEPEPDTEQDKPNDQLPSSFDDPFETDITKAVPQIEQPSGRLNFDQAAIDNNSDHGENVDEELISDNMDDGKGEIEDTHKDLPTFDTGLSESFLDVDKWQPESKSLFDREIKSPGFDDDHEDHTDESWAVDLLGELEDEEEAASNTPESPLDADIDVEPDAAPAARKEYSRATTGTFTALDDETLEAALGESFDSNEPHIGELGDPDDLEPFSNLDDLNEFDSINELDEKEGFVGGSEAIHANGQDRTDLAYSFEPEPVEMNWDDGQRVWKRKLLWGGLSLAAGLLLVIQTAWFQFDHFSRIEPYRNWYSSVCPLVGCRLPPLVDRSKIRTYNLVVRSHPRTEQALMVDTILLNTAPFKQPFPELVLTFSDLKGKPLATRRFTTREYLGGEMAGRTQMPSGQPIHLSLEVVDPGPEAVNYSASIP